MRWDELYSAAAHLYFAYIASPEFAVALLQPLHFNPGSSEYHFSVFSGWVDDVGARYDADTSSVVPFLRLVWFGALHNGWTNMWDSRGIFLMTKSNLRLAESASRRPAIDNGFPRMLAQTLLFPESGTPTPMGLWLPFWPENILAGIDDIGMPFNGWTYVGGGFFRPPPSRHRDFCRLAVFGMTNIQFLDDVVLVMAKIHLVGGPVFADVTMTKIRAAAHHIPFVRVTHYRHWDDELGAFLPRYTDDLPSTVFDDVYAPPSRVVRPQCLSSAELLDSERFPLHSVADDLRRENLCAEIYYRGNQSSRVPQASHSCERIQHVWTHQWEVCPMSMDECALTLHWHRMLAQAVLPRLSICSSDSDHEAVRRTAAATGGGTYILSFPGSTTDDIATHEFVVAVAWPSTTIAQLIQAAGHFSKSGLRNTVVRAASYDTPMALGQTLHQLRVTTVSEFVVAATDDGVINTEAFCAWECVTLRIWSMTGFGPVARWRHLSVTVQQSNTVADILAHLGTMCSFDLRDSFLRRRDERLPLPMTVQELGLSTTTALTLGRSLRGGADRENPRPRQRARLGGAPDLVASPSSAAQRLRFYKDQVRQRADGVAFLRGAIATWDDSRLRVELRSLGIEPQRQERTAVIRQRLLLALDLGFIDTPTVDSLRMVISEHFKEDASASQYSTKTLLLARFHELVQASAAEGNASADITALFSNDDDANSSSAGASDGGTNGAPTDNLDREWNASIGSSNMPAPTSRARTRGVLSRADTSASTSFGMNYGRTNTISTTSDLEVAGAPTSAPAVHDPISTAPDPGVGGAPAPAPAVFDIGSVPLDPTRTPQPRQTLRFQVPTTPVPTSLQEVWKGASSQGELSESVSQFLALEDPVLTPDAHGWRQVVHFAATSEFIRADFDDEEMRGKHFMTAVAIYCQRSDLISKLDLTGYGVQPTLVHQHELAAEYFGRLYQQGVTMLGSGASFQQISFSAVARRNLAGADTHAEPDPRSLCTFLSQLFAAGSTAEQGRPFRPHNTAAQPPHASSSAHAPLPVPVPEDVRHRIHTRALQLAPAGLPETMITAAFNATASHTEGSTFYFKHVDRLRKLGGTMVNDAVRAVSESQFVVVSGKRAAGAWISLVHEAIRHCTATRGNARCLNLQSDVMLQVTFAVITRQFTSKGFSLHLLVPQVPGLPTPKKIKELLGEAAQGLVGSLFTAATSPEELKGEVWNILLMALQQLLVLVFADFDFGFSIVVIFYIDHVPMFQSNALPFCMVTREIAKFFEESQRQRTITLQHTAASPSEVLSYIEPEELRRSRMALLDWNRETQALQDVQFQRSYDMAVQRGLLHNSARHSDRNRNRDRDDRNNRRNNDRRNNHGKGGGKGKGKGNHGKGGQRSENDPYGMDRSKWATAYGSASNGKKLCWWFSHGTKPCSRSPCSHVHAHPDKYNGKHFKDLSKSEQMAVMTACKH
jgi:hypothetical protein